MLHKIKNILGIEGAKVHLVIDTLSDHSIGGKCVLVTPQAQKLEGLKFVLKERYKRGRRKSKLVDTYLLLEENLEEKADLQPDVPFEIDFFFNYSKIHSPIDKFASRNVVTKALGDVAKWVKSAESTYIFTVEARIKGTRLSPFAEISWSDVEEVAGRQTPKA
jgi:hypothetical protein